MIATVCLVGASSAHADRLGAGSGHVLRITGDGAVVSWGDGSLGRLGNGSDAGFHPPSTIGQFADVVAVAAGREHSVALKRDGSVWAWGANASGELGAHDPEWVRVPIRVPGLPPVAGISAGHNHTLAWSRDGSVWAWGSNEFNQVGIGDTVDRTLPTRIPLPIRVVGIAAGARHSLVVSADGAVWAWGDDRNAQAPGAGSGHPVRVSGIGFAVAVAGGDEHSLALLADGSVWSWGGAEGQRAPSRVPELPQIVAISAGARHNLALDQTGGLWSWGANGSGQLGDGTYVSRASAARVALPGEVDSFLAEGDLSMALTRDGRLWTWGATGLIEGTDASEGQASPTTTEPVVMAAGPTAVATPTFSPAGGPYSTNQNVTVSCATSGAAIYYTTNGVDPTQSSTLYTGPVLVDSSRTLKARAYKSGLNPSAIASATYTLTPAVPSFTPAPGPYGTTQSVVITSTTPGAEIRVTTDLTDPTATSPLYTGPISVARPLTLKARAMRTGWTSSSVTTGSYVITTPATGSGVATYGSHFVVLKPDGTVWSWGTGSSGELGDGTTPTTSHPVPANITNVKAVAAGWFHTLALKNDGTVWAWGGNGWGQLGNGNTTQQNVPVRVGTLTGIVAIAAGELFSVAVDSTGAVWSWGKNNVGQLGDGTTVFKSSAVKIKSFAGVTAVAAGNDHVLARKSDGSLWSWGLNNYGQLGDNSQVNKNKPFQVVGLAGVAAIGAGGANSIAAKTDGTVWTWGLNGNGQLGDGTYNSPRLVPGAVPGLTGIVQVAGAHRSHAVGNDGRLWMWGAAGFNQLTPVVVAIPPVAKAAFGGTSVAITDDGTVWTWIDLTPKAISAPGFLFKAAGVTLTPAWRMSPWAFDVTLTSTMPGASIYYTTNGDDPSAGSLNVLNGGTVTINKTLTLRARVIPTNGYAPGDIAEGSYILSPSAPTISPTSQTVFLPTSIAFNWCDAGNTVHYTTLNRDPIPGTDPSVACTGASSLPSGLVINNPMTIRAVTTRPDWTPSSVSSETYAIKVGKPTFTPGGGNYSANTTVRLDTVTPTALIHYTTDGTEPTTASEFVSSGGTVSVSRSLVLRARAYRSGWPASDLAVAGYNLSLPAPSAPLMAPPGGTYTSPQNVTLSSSTSGAVIRYTLDGSDPNMQSRRYEGPLQVAASVTLKAKAFKRDRPASTTSSAAYVINLATTAAPRLSVTGGTYTTRQLVTATSPGAELHYTTNNAEPTLSDLSPDANGVITLDHTQVLKVKAWSAAGPSPTVTAEYVITGATAAATEYSVALKSDGTVWSWGANTQGQLGDGSWTDRLVPTQALALTDAVAISTSYQHTVALRRDGKVWAWGNNSHGQLGDGGTAHRNVPAEVAGLTNVVAIAAGGYHSLALKADGTVWYWGNDLIHGQRSSPGQLVSLPTGITQIGAGSGLSMALRTSGDSVGAAWIWGQLGGSRGLVTPVIDLADVATIAVGPDHRLAITAMGSVYVWGRHADGALGLPPPYDTRDYPQILSTVPALVGASGGGAHSLGAVSDGLVWGWGAFGYGQTGVSNGTHVPRVVDGIDAVIAVSAGVTHSLALRGDGTVWTFGSNSRGQLANGAPISWPFLNPVPAPVLNFRVVGGPAGHPQPSITPAAGTYSAPVTVTLVAGVGDQIHYTLDGSAPSSTSTLYTAPFVVGQSTTVTAKAFRLGWVPSQGSVAAYELKVALPSLSPSGGTYNTEQQVTVTSVTSDADLRYTTNGQDPQPTDAAVPANGVITVDQSMTLKVRGFKSGFTASDVGAGDYSLTLSSPVITPPAGTYLTSLTVVISVPSGATVRYTSDGSVPTPLSPLYTAPFALETSATVRAVAFRAGWTASSVASAIYEIKVASPTLTPAGGTYSAAQNVVITSATPGATIHYTTDGSVPTEGDAAINSGGTLLIDAHTTLKVRAWKARATASDVVSEVYTIGEAAAAPNFDPPSGTLNEPTAVSITSATTGVVIRFTLDGKEPTGTSLVYREPILVASNLTLKAKAFRTDLSASATATATYVMAPAVLVSPTLSPAGGVFPSRRLVRVTLPTTGAVMRYTQDGSDPTPTNGTPIASGETITVAGTTTIRVRAWKGQDASAITTGDFVLTGALALGARHTVALATSGAVQTWGSNDRGQLGNGAGPGTESPAVIAGLTDVIAIAAGDEYSLALRADGTAWAWGDNAHGQLGDGTTIQRSAPVQVAVNDIVAIAAGPRHATAVDTQGRVWTWGTNATNQLGRSGAQPPFSPTPQLVEGLPSVASVAAGFAHSLALTTSGRVWAWGSNADGQLGNTTSGGPTPGPVSIPAGVSKVAAGRFFSLAMRTGVAASTVWGWGAHGYGSTPSSLMAVELLDGVIDAAAGGHHVVALADDGSVVTWGKNDLGQLGDGTGVSRSQVRRLSGLPTPVMIAAGRERSGAVAPDGSVWLWGGGTTLPSLKSGVALSEGSAAADDPDGDGLSTATELQIGTDPNDSDSNDDGIYDGMAIALGLSPLDMDMDDDGLSNAYELYNGTSPWEADTDEDGVPDGVDAFPNDPTRWQPPDPTPGDVTPPTINLIEPADAVLISSVP